MVESSRKDGHRDGKSGFILNCCWETTTLIKCGSLSLGLFMKRLVTTKIELRKAWSLPENMVM